MNSPHLPAAPQQFSLRQQRVLLCTVAVATSVVVLVEPLWLAATVAAVVGAVTLFYVLARLVRGDAQPVMLAWVLVFPLGYYFLSIPYERPLITLDRAVAGALIIGMLLRGRALAGVPPLLQKAGVWWGVFLLVAAISLVKPGVGLNSVRVLVEGFLLPPVFALYVLTHFPVERQLRTLHVLTCLAVLYAAPIGIAELATTQDLLPLPAAAKYMAGGGFGEFIRANGPFQTNNSFGLIGLLSFCFLRFLAKAARHQFSFPERVLHWAGTGAAVVMALLPMFRSIALTMLLFVIITIWRSHSWKRRAALAFVLVVGGFAFAIFNAVMPDLYEERISSTDNVSARWIQQQQNLEVFLQNPLLGVGMGNFVASVPRITRYSAWNPHGVDPLDAPHNNWAAILAETGLLGFLPYVIAQVFFFLAFWRLRALPGPRAQLAWRTSVFLFLAYHVSGLSLTSGHYSDLNLWYLFTLAVVYRYGTSETLQLVARR